MQFRSPVVACAFEQVRSGVALLALVLCGLALAGAAKGQSAPSFTLPADSSGPVLVLRQWPTELAASAVQELRVFGDGRCTLHRPAILRGAGDHAWRIQASEVRELLAEALAAGVADPGASAHRASLRAAPAASAEAGTVNHFRFDDDTVEFEIAVDAYRSRAGATARNVKRALSWRGLRADRARHPNDDRVRRLLALRERLERMSLANAPLVAQP